MRFVPNEMGVRPEVRSTLPTRSLGTEMLAARPARRMWPPRSSAISPRLDIYKIYRLTAMGEALLHLDSVRCLFTLTISQTLAYFTKFCKRLRSVKKSPQLRTNLLRVEALDR